MGDGLVGVVGWGSGCAFGSEKIDVDSGGGVGTRGGDGDNDGGEMDEGLGGGSGGSAGKNTGGVEGDGRGEANNMDGDEDSSSSFSISLSSLTSAGGSMPYLRENMHSALTERWYMIVNNSKGSKQLTSKRFSQVAWDTSTHLLDASEELQKHIHF